MRKGLLIVLALCALWFLRPDRVVADFVTRGKRLTRSTLGGRHVEQTPAALAAEASRTLGREVSVEDYALARMIRSEDGSGPTPAKIAIAHVALNDARTHGWSLLFTICVDPEDRSGARFGKQAGDGRYSTAWDPYEVDLRIAEAVRSGAEPDNTGGAVKFVHKTGFRLPGSYAKTVKRWAADGLHPFPIEDGGSLVVFRRGGDEAYA